MVSAAALARLLKRDGSGPSRRAGGEFAPRATGVLSTINSFSSLGSPRIRRPRWLPIRQW
jgi:hypothetical protein